MEDPELCYYEETKQILDLTQNLYVTLKLVDSSSEFEIVSNSYKRAIKNYHVITIQKNYTVEDLGLFYVKVGIEEDFNTGSRFGFKDFFSKKKTISGSVTVRFEDNGKSEIFKNYLDTHNILYHELDLHRPENLMSFSSYREFEKIIDGILKHLV